MEADGELRISGEGAVELEGGGEDKIMVKFRYLFSDKLHDPNRLYKIAFPGKYIQ